MTVKRIKACNSSVVDVLDHVLARGVVIDVGPLLTDLLAPEPDLLRRARPVEARTGADPPRTAPPSSPP